MAKRKQAAQKVNASVVFRSQKDEAKQAVALSISAIESEIRKLLETWAGLKPEAVAEAVAELCEEMPKHKRFLERLYVVHSRGWIDSPHLYRHAPELMHPTNMKMAHGKAAEQLANPDTEVEHLDNQGNIVRETMREISPSALRGCWTPSEGLLSIEEQRDRRRKKLRVINRIEKENSSESFYDADEGMFVDDDGCVCIRFKGLANPVKIGDDMLTRIEQLRQAI